METSKLGAPARAHANTDTSLQIITPCKKVGKLDRMLSIFAGGKSLNTFEAQAIGDTCLHSTVSDLQGRHQITFNRESEKILSRFGTETRVCRYWLTGEHLERALSIVRDHHAGGQVMSQVKPLASPSEGGD